MGGRRLPAGRRRTLAGGGRRRAGGAGVRPLSRQALRIDPARIVVLGEDVGAQLAIQAATGGGVRGVALVGGVYDAATPSARRADAGRSRQRRLRVAARPGARVLRPHRGSLQARCAFDVVDGAIHRAENWRPSQWHYKPRLVAWLRRVLGEGAARPLDLHAAAGSRRARARAAQAPDLQPAPRDDAWTRGSPRAPGRTCRCCWSMAADGRPAIASPTSRRCSPAGRRGPGVVFDGLRAHARGDTRAAAAGRARRHRVSAPARRQLQHRRAQAGDCRRVGQRPDGGAGRRPKIGRWRASSRSTASTIFSRWRPA